MQAIFATKNHLRAKVAPRSKLAAQPACIRGCGMANKEPATEQDRYLIFSRNLHVALDHAKVPPGRGRASHLARALGVTTEACRLWLAGKSAPHGDRLTKLALFLDVSIEWLMTGRGPMGVGAKSGSVHVAEQSPEYFTADERELVNRYRVMPGEKKQLLLRLVRTM